MLGTRFAQLAGIMAALFLLAAMISCAGSADESRQGTVQKGSIHKTAQDTPQSNPTSIPAVVVSPQATEISEEIEPTDEPEPDSDSEPEADTPLEIAPNYNPLTGETAENELLGRRPIAVKISNSSWVRPQRGLASADILFEHLTEGGITRFTAIFYSKEGKQVGSIRSGRLIDLEIPLMFDAAFAYSGSSHQIKMMIGASSFFDRVVSPDFGHGGFYRDYSAATSVRPEDTMFTDTRTVRAALQERGQDTPPTFYNQMLFQSEIPDGGQPISSVEVTYPATSAYWSYNSNQGKFLRWSDGVRHMDANTNQQLAFDNVIVLRANHVYTDIIEDSGGSRSIQVQLWGEGPVTIFRDGYQYDGVWRREKPNHMLTFYDNDGEPLYLSPGSSFFQVVPLDHKQIYIEPS